MTHDDVLGQLFPPFVRGVMAPLEHASGSRWPQERAVVGGAADRRRREFLCGRACAHAALAALGRDEGPIGVGARRQPLWPPGVVGSISHAGERVAAVVADASEAWGLGLDVERVDPPLGADVEALVLSPAERRAAAGPGPSGRHRSKFAFSAKESVYKCLFPRTGWRLGFEDATVELDLEDGTSGAGTFRAVVAPRFRSPELDARSLEGRFVVADGYLFTGLALTA